MFSSEFKHGPLSAVHDGYPVLFITAPGDETMMINHVNEVTTAGRAGHRHRRRAPGAAGQRPRLPGRARRRTAFLSPILATLPAQLVAYHMSVARGIDPDFPRNLSKTLTVD